MKSGIYLGPPVGRMRRTLWALAVVAVLGTLLHAGVWLRQHAELETLRADIRRRESALADAAPEESAGTARGVRARLWAASQSGLSDTFSPTELLGLLMEAVPEDVALVGMSVELSSATPNLLVDAIARQEEDVTELQKRVAASPEVTATNLLEERRAPDGTLAVRLQVELSRQREP